MNQVLIPALEHGDSNPTICVRVSSLWEYRDQNNETILHNLSLVLVDQKGASIAAHIYPPLDKIFRLIITEGKVYYLTNYWVKPCSKNYRPVSNKMSISFTKWTTLEECIDVPNNFPCYAYSLTPYSELRTRIDRKDSFTDVMGVITEITSMTTIQTRIRDGDSLKRSVCIRNPDIQGNNEPIQFIDIPAPSAALGAEQKTVAEIKGLHPFKFKKHEFQVTVVIKKFCSESSWWYTACDICKKIIIAKPYGNAYKCTDQTCPPVVSASPRFKINLIAGDDTAETTFILFGRLAQRLIGRSTDALIQENRTDKGYIPSAITYLLEKQFIWNVSITENTVATGNVSFQVNRIVGGAPSHSLALLQSPSASQASSIVPTMALSPTASRDQSIAMHSAIDTPSVDISDAQLSLTSPAITPA